MSYPRLTAWLLVAAAAVVLLAWAVPRTFPLLPRQWTISHDEAVDLALERFRDLGEPVDDGYVIARLIKDEVAENRLLQALRAGGGGDALRGSRLAGAVVAWEVTVYEPGARAGDWFYRALVGPGGELLVLRRQAPSDAPSRVEDAAPAAALSGEEARAAADAFLRREGFELAAFAEPETRAVELQSRTDQALRYRDRAAVLGDEVPYGVEVLFAGDQLSGYQLWYEDPEGEAFVDSWRPLVLVSTGWRTLPILLAPVVAVFFLRRYHAGEVGVRRSLHLFALSMGSGLLLLVLVARIIGVDFTFGVLSQQQMTAVAALQMVIGFFGPVAAIAFLSWSVGEVLCRERGPWRLAAFDALFKGALGNATVARASLQGIVSGLVLVAAVVAVPALETDSGAWTLLSANMGPWWDSAHWSGLALLLFMIPIVLYSELFGRLLLTSALVRRLGSWLGGAVAAVAGGLLLFPPMLIFPATLGVAVWIAAAGFLVVVFLRYGLLATLLAALTSSVAFGALPFLHADDPWLQLQGSLPLLVVALPLLLSLRHITSGREFVYLYDDVPPHVRRIAERERQRVELETARRIQSSILPDLPPSIAGIEVAHAYLPATEVGGDFYDVLALEDGRLAVAIGDVAGHGVSSGLVMSMAKSALAVQVTFNPEVEAVVRTLNRVIYQSARKRLLATLCYTLVDPVRRELVYASAGHLYPYLIQRNGEVKVEPLEYYAYPLGVRSDMDVAARVARFQSGDTLFLLSDGLTEAHAQGSDELYGFERLEDSLRRHAHATVSGLRDGVLADIDAYTGGSPRDDDQTVLVLRLP